MAAEHSRISREKKTVKVMIEIYCKKHHQPKKISTSKLCSECSELLDYAQKRLTKCPFQENKTTCAKCSIHCYSEPQKTRIKEVMRYSGPRMLGRHPILALHHIFDKFRKEKRKKG
jgi:hypothetical protein